MTEWEEPIEIYGKPYHGWSCDCDDCQWYMDRNLPRPGEAPTNGGM